MYLTPSLLTVHYSHIMTICFMICDLLILSVLWNHIRMFNNEQVYIRYNYNFITEFPSGQMPK